MASPPDSGSISGIIANALGYDEARYGKQTTASVYDPFKGGINGSPDKGGCGVPSRQIPWSIAHKSIACGTIVTIRNETNKKFVNVPVGDRGPFVVGRDVDLRPDVANALGVSGLAKVTYISTKARINMRDYAAKGGNAKAMEELLDAKGDPFGKIKATESPVETIGSSNPGFGATGVLGGAFDGVKAIGAAVTDVVNFAFGENAAENWLRIGKVLGGLVLILVALTLIGKSSLSPIKIGGK